jgi:hypothetical protein
MERKRSRSFLLAAFILSLGGLLLSCGEGDGSRGSDGEREKIKSEDVRREIGEAYEATKGYLVQTGDDLAQSFNERMGALAEDIDRLGERAAAAQERGREEADRALQALKEKEEAAREKLEEFKAAGGEMKKEAAEKLDRALRELEEAYRRARERYDQD